MIRANKLRAELEQRAPGDPRTVWRIWQDDPQEPSTGHPQPPTAPERDQPQPPATEPPAATTRLLDMLSERDETIRDQSARIAELEREAGRLEGQAIAANAERDARADALELVQAQLDQARAELERVKARRWWNPSTW